MGMYFYKGVPLFNYHTRFKDTDITVYNGYMGHNIEWLINDLEQQFTKYNNKNTILINPDNGEICVYDKNEKQELKFQIEDSKDYQNLKHIIINNMNTVCIDHTENYQLC